MKNTAPSPTSEKLFSYGTLQYLAVQLETFERPLARTKDALLGYQLSYVEITDAAVIALSGESIHKMLKPTGNPQDVVEGMVFDVTARELELADSYEVDAYKRIQAPLKSGGTAWVYVDTNSTLTS